MDALQQYWSALEKIDSRYGELETSRTELRWYQEKIKQTDELAKRQQFEAISTIQLDFTDSPISLVPNLIENAIHEFRKLEWYRDELKKVEDFMANHPFEAISAIQLDPTDLPEGVTHKLMESAIEELHRHLDEFYGKKKEEQYRQEEGIKKLNTLEQESSGRLKSLKAELQNSDCRTKELTKRIDSLKTARLGYICFFVGIGIMSALLTGDATATFIITGIAFTVVSVL